MPKAYGALAVAALSFILFTDATVGQPCSYVNDSTSVYDMFTCPPKQFRPKFRYWLPDGSIPPEVLRQDIDSIADVGGGGFEFVPYYLYGLPLGGDPPTDWTQFSFGSPAYKTLLKTALEHSKERDTVLDIGQGASQGQGVPSIPRTEGLARELIYGKTEIKSGNTFKGPLPRPREGAFLPGFMHEPERFGDGVLMKVLAGSIKRITNSTVGGSPSEVITLDENSIIDLTAKVTNGSLTWRSPAGNDTWAVIAFYENYTNQRSCSGAINATDIIANGSWIVDHFSASGAKRITDFWDQNILDTEEMKELVASAGNYFWEDSMEMQATLFWTQGFLQRFESGRGYSLVKYLPLLFNMANQWGRALPPYSETWEYDAQNPKENSAILDDYRTTLTEGYKDYLRHMVSWAHSLGVQYSSQPAYNLPLDMAAALTILDAPELESLAFTTIDTERQFTGSALLAGKSVISTEVGAVSGASYTQTIPELLNLFKTSFAGGVSMMVIHGFSYTGEYPGTTWPGYNAFQFAFTEMWNNKVPSWAQIRDALDYTARNSLVLQTGRPQTDIAFYYYGAPFEAATRFQSSVLSRLGYSYDYLGPQNIIPNITIHDHMTLSRSSYKALVFSNESSVSESVLQSIESYAKAGLPIFFVGDVPSDCIGINACLSRDVRQTIRSTISRHKNIQTVSDAESLPAALLRSNIRPRVSFGTPADSWTSVWRKDDVFGESYVYLYNAGAAATVEVEFALSSSYAPYLLDAWTGKKVPVLQYSRSDLGIAIPVTLQANQTTIFSFSDSQSCSGEGLHILSSIGDVTSFEMLANGDLEARAAGPATLKLSDGRVIKSNFNKLPAEDIALWDLSVKSYRPASLTSTATAFDYINVTRQALEPWSKIAGLKDVSGEGMYNSTFNFPYDPAAVGASMSFGPVKDTLRAWINGNALPPVDPTAPSVDISCFLQKGLNSVQVSVTSTLFNAVKARANSTLMVANSAAESNPIYASSPLAEFGLIGPVRVQPLQRISLS